MTDNCIWEGGLQIMKKFQDAVIETFSKPSFMQAVKDNKESNLNEAYTSKANKIYLGLLNITAKIEDIEDESNAEFCQLETASKRINYLSKELQNIHDDSENNVIEKITSLLDEQYSFEKSKLDTYSNDSSIGKCAQSRMHLIDELKLKIKENKTIKKVGIVSGNYNQYKSFICTKLDPEKYFYIGDITNIIGKRDIKVLFYGSCRERKDYTKIYEYIMSHDIEIVTTL